MFMIRETRASGTCTEIYSKELAPVTVGLPGLQTAVSKLETPGGHVFPAGDQQTPHPGSTDVSVQVQR